MTVSVLSAGAAVDDMPQSEYGVRYQKPIVPCSATADKIGWFSGELTNAKYHISPIRPMEHGAAHRRRARLATKQD